MSRYIHQVRLRGYDVIHRAARSGNDFITACGFTVFKCELAPIAKASNTEPCPHCKQKEGT